MSKPKRKYRCQSIKPDVDNMDRPTPEQRTGGGTPRHELQIVYLIQDKFVDIAVPDHQPVILHTDRIEHNFTFKSNSCTLNKKKN